MRNDLDVIYEDGELLVCRKPAGLAVQSAAFGQRDLESMARTYLMEKTGRANPYLAVVHRLDQPVQGLVVFARAKKAAASLSAQLQDGRMKKEYTAVLCGTLPQKSGVLVHYLKKEPTGNRSGIAEKETPGAKRAELSYEILREQDGLTMVKILLKTGRHHQIRVQLAAVGAPIYGDGKYGAQACGSQERGARACEDGGCGARTLALCASRLCFFHPGSGKQLEFTVEPADFPI